MSDAALSWNRGKDTASAPARPLGRVTRRFVRQPQETHWTPVCKLEDIVPDTGVCALVDGRQVAVFRLDDDRVYAIGNYDPFSRANVLSRGIVGDVKGELVVASPVYKQHFSLCSGQCLEDPEARVPVFQVRVDGGTVWVRA